jgi:hypothetical protein
MQRPYQADGAQAAFGPWKGESQRIILGDAPAVRLYAMMQALFPHSPPFEGGTIVG